jgi:rubrerythrin
MSGIPKMFANAATVFLLAAGTFAGATASTTLQNMQTAFNGESNAHMRYLAFAEQADRENYGEVASLFRAAARAEAVHASNHAQVIKGMGAVPQANIEIPEVKSTRENLEAAIKGETYERDTMYPSFLQQARLDGNEVAVRSLQLAATAEAQHAKLYTRSLQDLNKLKGSKSAIFFVCPTCGYTASQLEFANCPSCFTPREDFESVT